MNGNNPGQNTPDIKPPDRKSQIWATSDIKSPDKNSINPGQKYNQPAPMGKNIRTDELFFDITYETRWMMKIVYMYV